MSTSPWAVMPSTSSAAENQGRLLPDSWRPRPDGRGQLLATRCPRCAALTFPAAATCPACWNTDGLRAEEVPEPGTVYAFSTVRVAGRGAEVPYRIGYADFPGGLRVCGRLTGPPVDIGDPVEVVTTVLRPAPDPLLGWAFQKAAPGQGAPGQTAPGKAGS